jgi:hypothetical protein
MIGPVFTFRGEVVAKNFILCESINYARLIDVVRRHFEFHTIAGRKADKTFAHFSGDMRKHKVFIRQRDAKHGAGKHGHNRPFYFDSLF